MFHIKKNIKVSVILNYYFYDKLKLNHHYEKQLLTKPWHQNDRTSVVSLPLNRFTAYNFIVHTGVMRNHFKAMPKKDYKYCECVNSEEHNKYSSEDYLKTYKKALSLLKVQHYKINHSKLKETSASSPVRRS